MSIKRTRKGTKIKAGSASVTISNTLEVQADQIAKEFAPDLSQLMTSEMGRLYDAGMRKWPSPGTDHPYATGRSARAMDFEPASFRSSGVIVTSVSNPARSRTDGYPYPYAIRTKKSRGKAVWNEYFGKPFKKRTKAVIGEMVDTFMTLTEVK